MNGTPPISQREMQTLHPMQVRFRRPPLAILRGSTDRRSTAARRPMMSTDAGRHTAASFPGCNSARATTAARRLLMKRIQSFSCPIWLKARRPASSPHTVMSPIFRPTDRGRAKPSRRTSGRPRDSTPLVPIGSDCTGVTRAQSSFRGLFRFSSVSIQKARAGSEAAHIRRWAVVIRVEPLHRPVSVGPYR